MLSFYLFPCFPSPTSQSPGGKSKEERIKKWHFPGFSFQCLVPLGNLREVHIKARYLGEMGFEKSRTLYIVYSENFLNWEEGKCRKDTENRVWGGPRERALLTVPLTGIWKRTKLSIGETAFYLGNSTPEREWLLGMAERAIYSLTQVSFSEGPELSESLWN